jgi:cytochrome c2
MLTRFGDCIIALLVLGLCGTAVAQQSSGARKANQPTAAASAELNKMIAAGNSQPEIARFLFDTHGCKDCHTLGQGGKLGFTGKGKQTAEGFEGCISTLTAMSVIAKVQEDQRSATQRRRAERFEEFGCATCHKVAPGKLGLTEVGAKLANLHLGCVEVQKVLAAGK